MMKGLALKNRESPGFRRVPTWWFYKIRSCKANLWQPKKWL